MPFRVDRDFLEDLWHQGMHQAYIEAYEVWLQSSVPNLQLAIEQIRSAFSGVQLGEGTGLYEARGIDDYASEAEMKLLKERDERSDWQTLTPEQLAECHSSPSFFDARGFLFHLPAFLIAELNDQHEFGFADRLFAVAYGTEGWPMLLNRLQRDSIARVLELVVLHARF